ncbi:MAG: hypothetical protein ACLGIR_12450 [Actinomycetes bacterium]
MTTRRGGLVALALGVLTTTALGPVPSAPALDAGPSGAARWPAATAGAGWEPAAGVDGLTRVRLTEDGVERDRAARGITDLVEQHAGTGTPIAPRDLLGAALERAGARALFDTDRSHEETVEEEPGEEISFEGTVAFPETAGDLDGDGVLDLVVATYDLGSGTGTLEGVRGSDGSTLWARDATGGFAYLAGDTDGDGVDDVLLLDLEVLEEEFEIGCDDDGCRFEFVLVADVTTSELDGRTGETRWADTSTMSIRESDEFRSTATGYSGQLTIEVTDARFVVPVGDLDGDGRADLVADQLDELEARFTYEGTGVGAVVAYVGKETTTETFTATSRQVRFDGGEASTVYDEHDGAGGANFLLPVDVDGDGTTELLRNRFRTVASSRAECVHVDTPVVGEVVCPVSEVEGESLEDLALLDGDGSARWSRPFAPVIHFPFPAGDLDGGGGEDLLVELLSLDGSDDETVALDAATGEELWRRSTSFFGPFLLPGGDLDGDGDADLLELAFEEDDDEIALVVGRIDGSTGTATGVVTRRAERVAGEDGFGASAFLSSGLEADGAAGSDLLVGLVVFDDEGVHGGVGLERGVDGASILDLPVDEVELFGLDDLDGDGTVDTITSAAIPFEEICFEDEEFGETFCSFEPVVDAVDLTARTLPERTELWTLPQVGLSSGSVFPVADLDGDLGAEVLRFSDTYEFDGQVERYDAGFTVLRGRDATALWSRGRVA